MHETGLVKDLIRRIEGVAAENGARGVVRIRVRLGALSHLDSAHFREHFEREALGSIAEHARLELIEDSATLDPRAQEIVLEDVEISL